jgi:hypothetical protein
VLKRLFLLLPLFFGVLFGIQCISADGTALDLDSREYHYHYHSSTNDLNFFGANRWGVRFNFRTAYPGMSEVNFRVQGARLWFPNPGDAVTVELMSDVNGDPGIVLATQTAAVTDNHIDLYFDTEHIAEKVWLMVDYNTNMSNRFVAASSGGGSNSFYMNQVDDIQHLASLAQAGFNCELLFGVLGDFVFDQVDLELGSFALEGDLLPQNRVWPSFSVYNHSDSIISNASLNLILSRPGFAQYDTLDIIINDTLAPYEQYEYDGSGFAEAEITLPDEPTQLRVEATLTSEYTENDTLIANNYKLLNYQVFSDQSPLQLVENFMRQDETVVINSIQQPYLTDTIHSLQYYPILSDSLANLDSMQRFNWYGFNTIPRTTLAGTQHVIGFTDLYQDRFLEALDQIQSQRSFISSSSCSMQPMEDSENVSVNIQFSNENTSLYTQSGQSLMIGSRIFAGLFQKQDFDGQEGYVLERWIAFADTVNSTLDIGSSVEKSYSFTTSGLSDTELQQDYRLYYWVQANSGGRIYYTNFSDFCAETFTANSDAQAPGINFSLYPNPVRAQQDLKVSVTGSARLRIFNLRGQLIYANDAFRSELILPNNIFPAAGIYFVRINQEGRVSNTKKISIIK